MATKKTTKKYQAGGSISKAKAEKKVAKGKGFISKPMGGPGEDRFVKTRPAKKASKAMGFPVNKVVGKSKAIKK